MESKSNPVVRRRRKSSEIDIKVDMGLSEAQEKSSPKLEEIISPTFKKQDVSSIIYSDGQKNQISSTGLNLFSELNKDLKQEQPLFEGGDNIIGVTCSQIKVEKSVKFEESVDTLKTPQSSPSDLKEPSMSSTHESKHGSGSKSVRFSQDEGNDSHSSKNQKTSLIDRRSKKKKPKSLTGGHAKKAGGLLGSRGKKKVKFNSGSFTVQQRTAKPDKGSPKKSLLKNSQYAHQKASSLKEKTKTGRRDTAELLDILEVQGEDGSKSPNHYKKFTDSTENNGEKQTILNHTSTGSRFQQAHQQNQLNAAESNSDETDSNNQSSTQNSSENIQNFNSEEFTKNDKKSSIHAPRHELEELVKASKDQNSSPSVQKSTKPINLLARVQNPMVPVFQKLSSSSSNTSGSNASNNSKDLNLNMDKIINELKLIQYSKTLERRDGEYCKKNKLLDLSNKGKKYYDSAEYFLRKEEQKKAMEDLKEKQEKALKEYSKKYELEYHQDKSNSKILKQSSFSKNANQTKKMYPINLLMKNHTEKFDSADYYMKMDIAKANAQKQIQREKQNKAAKAKNT